MQQAVHREHRVEPAAEIEVQEVLLERDESLRAAVLDHARGQVGADDFEPGVGEEPSVNTGTGADLE